MTETHTADSIIVGLIFNFTTTHMFSIVLFMSCCATYISASQLHAQCMLDNIDQS